MCRYCSARALRCAVQFAPNCGSNVFVIAVGIIGRSGMLQALVATVIGQSYCCAIAAEERSVPGKVLAEFAVEKDGGPLILPVEVHWSDTRRRRMTTCRMLLDTGAVRTCFDVAYCRRLGGPTGKCDVFGADSLHMTKVETFKTPLMRLAGGVRLRSETDVLCLDTSRIAEAFGQSIDGILGMDVLRNVIFSLDFDNGTIRFHSAPDSTCGRRVPLLWSDQVLPGCPVVRATLPDGTTEDFALDTGSIQPYSGGLRTEPYDRLSRLRWIVPAVVGSPDATARIEMVDAGVDVTLGRITKLSLGGFSHDGLIFGRFRRSWLGMGYLSRFHVQFDFPHDIIYLRPGSKLTKPDACQDLSGLVLARRGDAILVKRVLRSGPGHAAGIRKGDNIIEMDGMTTSELSLARALCILSFPGRRKIRLTRGGAELTAIIELKAPDVILGAPAKAGPTTRWAFLTGVDHHDQASPERYCGNDQSALATQLIKNGFRRDSVVVLHERAAKNAFIPSKSNFWQQFAELLARVNPGDSLLVGISAQGMFIKNSVFVCPSDGNLDDTRTLVPLDEIFERLTHIPAALKIVLLDIDDGEHRDAGEGAKSDYTVNLATRVARMDMPPGLVLLNSCSDGEVANVDEECRHSVFMRFLLKGLEGDADEDRNCYISWRELSQYATDRTQEYVARALCTSQRPFLRGNVAGREFDAGIFAAAKTGETIVNTIGMSLVLVPAGEYRMGGTDTVPAVEQAFGAVESAIGGMIKAEAPQHPVRITTPFFMGICEVTRAQFAIFAMEEDFETDAETSDSGGWGWDSAQRAFSKKAGYTWRSWGFEQPKDHPVVNVSFNDARQFCAWLSRREGKTYRLPTEAEWEYACRAGTTGRFYNGDDPKRLSTIGNAADVTAEAEFGPMLGGGARCRDGHAFTSPGGRFAPNSFGLYDMVGNVAEWCDDWYDPTYYYNCSQRNDPKGPTQGTLRVIRGGGWTSLPVYCRSSQRSAGAPRFRHLQVGFRVVCDR